MRLTHEVGLGSDLEGDTTGGGLGVVDSLGTSLDILANSVVVRSSKGGEVSETVEGDGVVGGGVTESTCVSGDGTGSDIVRCLGTNKETVSANNSVGSEGGALGVSTRLTAYDRRLALKRSTVARVWREGCL